MRRSISYLVLIITVGCYSEVLKAQPQAHELINKLSQNLWGSAGVYQCGHLQIHYAGQILQTSFVFLGIPAGSSHQQQGLFQARRPHYSVLRLGTKILQYPANNKSTRSPNHFYTRHFRALEWSGGDDLHAYDWKLLGPAPHYSQKYHTAVWELQGQGRPGAAYAAMRLAVMENPTLLLRQIFYNRKKQITRVLVGSDLQVLDTQQKQKFPSRWIMVDLRHPEEYTQYRITRRCHIQSFPRILFSRPYLRQVVTVMLQASANGYHLQLSGVEPPQRPPAPLKVVRPVYACGYQPLQFWNWAYQKYCHSSQGGRYLWLLLALLLLVGDAFLIIILGGAYLLRQQLHPLAGYIYWGTLGVLLLLALWQRKWAARLLLLAGMTLIGALVATLLSAKLYVILIGAGAGFLLAGGECLAPQPEIGGRSFTKL